MKEYEVMAWIIYPIEANNQKEAEKKAKEEAKYDFTDEGKGVDFKVVDAGEDIIIR